MHIRRQVTRAATAVGLALVMTLVAAAPARAGREVSFSYVGGADPLASALLMTAARVGTCPTYTLTVGTGCYAIRPGETSMRIRIDDVSGHPVGGVIGFYGRDGIMHSYLSFCRRAVVDLPPSVATIQVRVAPVGACNAPAAATAGRIIAYFE